MNEALQGSPTVLSRPSIEKRSLEGKIRNRVSNGHVYPKCTPFFSTRYGSNWGQEVFEQTRLSFTNSSKLMTQLRTADTKDYGVGNWLITDDT